MEKNNALIIEVNLLNHEFKYTGYTEMLGNRQNLHGFRQKTLIKLDQGHRLKYKNCWKRTFLLIFTSMNLNKPWCAD